MLLEKKPSDVSVVAWCLMDNHMHLLLHADWQTTSRLMQRTLTSYAQRYNGRHGHVGKVFQGRYASTAIEADSHLLAAIRYIHRNAFDAGASCLENYQWSSYRQIAGITPFESPSLCDESVALELFGSQQEFVRFHEDTTETDDFCDISGYRPRLDDSEAQSIACRQFGENFADKIASMSKQRRNESLAMLKLLGLSVRQIERLTGIGRNIIARAK